MLPGIVRSEISPEFLADNQLRVGSVLEISCDEKFESSTLTNDLRQQVNGAEGYGPFTDFTIVRYNLLKIFPVTHDNTCM